MEEIWKPVKDFETRYLVSNLGNIKSLRTNTILKDFKNKDGYCRVALWDGSGYTKKSVHILVAEAFLEKPISDEKLEVDHIDCNPSNNRLDNLQWLTRKENLERSFVLKHQFMPKREVKQLDKNGNIIAIYESVNEAFRQTNIRHISEVARGVRKTAGGYIWKYTEGSDNYRT